MHPGLTSPSCTLCPSLCSHDFIGEFTTSYKDLSRGQSQLNVYEVNADKDAGQCCYRAALMGADIDDFFSFFRAPFLET